MNDTDIIKKYNNENPLAKHFNVKQLLKFTFPTIFMMVFSGLYTVVDTMFVARFINTNALSSINIVTPVINVIVGLGAMFATGGSAIVARKMGDGNNKEARSNFTMIVITAVIIGIFISIFGLLFIDKIIRMLGASDILFPYAKEYLTILLIFAPANILQVVFVNLFITAGKPGLGMGVGLAAGITNAVFDYILIVPLQMGITGAALATSMGYLLQAIVGVIFFVSNKKGTLYFVRPQFDLKVLKESSFNGLSEMVSQLSMAVTTFLFNLTMIRLLGEDGVAAITIIIYSQFLLTTFYIGFSMGVAPIFSYNYGSENIKELKRIFRICILFITLVSVVVFVGSMIGGPYLVALFSEKGTQVYDIAKMGFLIFPFSFLFCGVNIFSSSLFTALSNGKVSAIISFLRTFVFLTIGILVLPFFLNEIGIWLAVPLAELLTLIISIYFIIRHKSEYCYY